ncbi:MAG: hypothetical protein ACE14M_10175 [Terriglobales bacterium]
MTYLLITLTALVVLILAIYFRWMRIVLAVLAAVVAVFAIYFFYVEPKARESEREASKHRVPVSEVDFGDLNLAKEEYGSDYRLKGRIRNRSGHELLGAEILVKLEDCLHHPSAKYKRIPAHEEVQLPDGKVVRFPKGSTEAEIIAAISRDFPLVGSALDSDVKCETVGQSSVEVVVEVPPNQTRALDASVHFASLPSPRGFYVWRYVPVNVRAKQR